MEKTFRNFLKKLSYFDIFIILVVITALFIVGIRLVSGSKTVEKEKIPVKLTFLAANIENKIADNLIENSSVFINNSYAGDSVEFQVKPQPFEAITQDGKLKLFESYLKKQVEIIVNTEVEKTDLGYLLDNVNLSIGSQYIVKAGAVTFQQATLINIKETQ